MNTQHTATDWFTPGAVLDNAEEFGKAVISGLHNLKNGTQHDLFTLQRALETAIEKEYAATMQEAILAIYPDAVGVTWDLYASDGIGNVAATFESIQMADGTSISEDSYFDFEEENEQAEASDKYWQVEEIFTQYIYNFGMDGLQEETFKFTK